MATYKQYAISSGHALKVRGASCYIDEVDEARKVVTQVVKLLKARGCTVKEIHDNTSTTKAQNITNGRSSYLVKAHNGSSREIDISVHFNASSKTTEPRGTEVFYYSDNMKAVASELSSAMAKAGGFKNRGAKKSTSLAFLKSTDKPALLLEVCFVDSKADVDLYKKNFNAICEAITKTLSGKNAPTTSATTPSTGTATNPNQIGVAKVLVDSLNLREKADFNSKVVGTIKKGQSYKVYKKENGLLNLGGNQWCSAGEKYVQYTQLPYVVGALQKDVKITENLNVRAGRGAEYELLGSFKKGELVNVWYIDKASNGTLWGSCSINGQTGYINMNYTERV